MVVGDWSLEETINLIKIVEKANNIEILYPLTKIKIDIRENPKKAMKFSEDKIKVYSD